ncbi:hypothetical protein C6P46_006222 [Rhodotorula mucilaginosa]|jgi:hypothetical protein|uniref:F-box domain-containing protein n=1 Tax=Rhodotorula mucilaginosa TaxID=5537 RepID=A0A9P6VYR7_RHOMI|nr:hypothetical protein C6P46_006222 [Rhodotorula mucilaginosa]
MDLLRQPSPSEPAGAPATIGILPDDVLETILARLADKVDADGRDRQKELLPLERVCKRWRPFILDVAWEIVVIRSPAGEPSNIKYLLAHPDMTERVRVIMEDTKASMRALKSVTSATGCLRSQAVLQLLGRCTRLTRLNLAFVFPEDDLLPTICTAQHAENLKSLTLMPMLRDASSLSRLLEHLAKLHNLVGLGFNWTAGDLSTWSPSSMTIERPLRLRSLGLQMVSAGEGSSARTALALRALRSILAPEALDLVKLKDWVGDPATIDVLAEFPNLRVLDVALHLPAPDVAQGLAAMRNLASLRILSVRHSLDQTELVVKSPASLRDFLACAPPNLEEIHGLSCRVFAFPADELKDFEVLEVGPNSVPLYLLVSIRIYEDETKLAQQEVETRFFMSITPLSKPTWRCVPADGAHGAKAVPESSEGGVEGTSAA